MNLNLHLLRMFAAVVENQGFSRAAAMLHVTQPAVSKAVRELEHQLDLPLIERSGGPRGIRLTEAGQALYEHARGIFAMERIALDDIRDRVDARRGRLRIGASTTVASYWLPASLSRFLAIHPDIELTLIVGNTAKIAHALVSGDLDVGFVEGRVEDTRIEVTPWKQEPLQIVVAWDSALSRRRRPSIEVLSHQTWLLRESGSGTRQVTESWLAANAIVPQRTLELGSNEAIARAVAAGAGLALLPEVVVADLVSLGRLRRLRAGIDDSISRPLLRLELANRPRPPTLRAWLMNMAVRCSGHR